MSIRAVTVKEMVQSWKDNPQELLNFILELIWEAGIKPTDSISWITENGKITIITKDIMIAEAKNSLHSGNKTVTEKKQ